MAVDTLSEALIEFLVNNGTGTFGLDLFLGQVPDTAPDTCYWLITSGGTPIQKMPTGEKVKQYFASIHYRSTASEQVEKKLFELEGLFNCLHCINLTGFEVVSSEANQFPTDEDLDNEERKTGFIQVNIKTYKKEC